MTQPFETQHPEIDDLFDRYRRAPGSTIFAPLADACRKAGMIEEALDICRKGLESNPRYASGYVVQGKCLYDAERPAEAEAAFRKVLALDPKNLVALKFIGIILSERGDAGAARACFEHILALDPDDRDIRRRLEEVGDAKPSAVPREPRPVPRHAVNAPAAASIPETVELRATQSEPGDAGDDDFEGAPITLGDESGTTDEIATMTLADIYAAQGYTEKALRIYHEVSRRQPNNEELRRRISALETRAREAAASVEAAEPVAVAPEEPPIPSRPAGPARPASGSRIDETRSYEQFKRWLRSVSD